MGGFAGILGGALQGFGQGVAGAAKMEMEEQAQTNRMLSLKEMQRQLEVEREARIAERTQTPGTKEYVEAQVVDRQLQAADLKLKAAKDESLIESVRRGGTGQMSDGTFAVTGDDGKVRTLREDGTPIDLKGRSADEFERLMMSPKERADIEFKEAQTRLSRDRGAHLGASGSSSGGKAKADVGVPDIASLAKTIKGAFYEGKDATGADRTLPDDWGHRLSVVQDVLAKAAEEGKIADPARVYQQLDAAKAWTKKPEQTTDKGGKPAAKASGNGIVGKVINPASEAEQTLQFASEQRKAGNTDYAKRLEAKAQTIQQAKWSEAENDPQLLAYKQKYEEAIRSKNDDLAQRYYQNYLKLREQKYGV